MRDRTLGRLPVQTNVNESDHKERTPEYDIGQSDDDEHLHMSNSLLLELNHEILELVKLGCGNLHQILELKFSQSLVWLAS